jgi:3alpha(or 20beta)-hydroxysteroid dehydrogenase
MQLQVKVRNTIRLLSPVCREQERKNTMPSRLDGQVIIVTGGTRGMGEAIVRGIVRGGGMVVFGGRDTERGEGIAAELGENVRFVRQDVSVESDWIQIVNVALETFGRIDGLVNNAGMMGKNPITETDAELVGELVATNQTAILLGMKHIVPEMRRAGGGSIVNIGSVAVARGMAMISAYSGAKAAVAAISRSAAAELGPDGIRVNTIHPGAIATNMLSENVGPNAHEISAQLTPMGRVGQPSEIAGPVIFLLSADSSYVTGAEVAVDGGRAI